MTILSFKNEQNKAFFLKKFVIKRFNSIYIPISTTTIRYFFFLQLDNRLILRCILLLS